MVERRKKLMSREGYKSRVLVCICVVASSLICRSRHHLLKHSIRNRTSSSSEHILAVMLTTSTGAGRSTRARMIMRKDFITRLPPEIFCEIFRHSEFDELFDATHVCSWWRSVLNRCPSLWTTIPLWITQHPYAFQELLARSQPYQVNITVALSYLTEGLRDTIFGASKRIQCLKMVFDSLDDAFLDDFANLEEKPSNLRVFAGVSGTKALINLPNFQALEELYMIDVCVATWSVLGAMPLLRVLKVQGMLMSCGDFRDILLGTPNLTHFHLNDVDLDLNDDDVELELERLYAEDWHPRIWPNVYVSDITETLATALFRFLPLDTISDLQFRVQGKITLDLYLTLLMQGVQTATLSPLAYGSDDWVLACTSTTANGRAITRYLYDQFPILRDVIFHPVIQDYIQGIVLPYGCLPLLATPGHSEVSLPNIKSFMFALLAGLPLILPHPQRLRLPSVRKVGIVGHYTRSITADELAIILSSIHIRDGPGPHLRLLNLFDIPLSNPGELHKARIHDLVHELRCHKGGRVIFSSRAGSKASTSG